MPTFDFESGISGWTTDNPVFAAISHDATGGRSGGGALRISTSSGSPNGYDRITSPTSYYDVGWYKVVLHTRSGAGVMFFQFSVGDSIGQGRASAFSPSFRMRQQYVYVAAAGNYPFVIYPQSNPGNIWIDDIDIQPVTGPLAFDPGVDTVGRYFQDADSAADNFRYSPSAGVILSSDYAHSGTQSYKLEGASRTVEVLVPMTGFTSADFGCWVYVPTGSPSVVLTVLDLFTPANTWTDTSTTNDAWEFVSVSVPADSIVYGDVAWDITISTTVESTSPSYVDEMVWTPTGITGSGLIGKQDFENFDDGFINGAGTPTSSGLNYWFWRNATPETLEVVSDFSRAGSKSLRVNFPDTLNMNVEWFDRAYLGWYSEWSYIASSTKEVVATCWVYVPAGQPAVTFAIINDNSDDSVLLSTTSTTTGAWEKLEIRSSLYNFSYLGYFNHYLWTESATVGQTSEFWVDDISVGHAMGNEVTVDIELTGDLTLFLGVDGSVDVDIEPVAIIPFPEPVSAEMEVGVTSLMGQSARYYAFNPPGTQQEQYGWFGFENQIRRDENEGDYWWDERYGNNGTTDSGIYYRIGHWVGGAQGSQFCLMYVVPTYRPDTPGGPLDRYETAATNHRVGKRHFALRVIVWVYNEDPVVPLVVRFYNYYSQWNATETAPEQIFSEQTTRKHGEWEMMFCDIPAYTEWDDYTGGSGGDGVSQLHMVGVNVFSSIPARRHVFYVDNLDFAWFADGSTLPIASV